MCDLCHTCVTWHVTHVCHTNINIKSTKLIKNICLSHMYVQKPHICDFKHTCVSANYICLSRMYVQKERMIVHMIDTNVTHVCQQESMRVTHGCVKTLICSRCMFDIKAHMIVTHICTFWHTCVSIDTHMYKLLSHMCVCKYSFEWHTDFDMFVRHKSLYVCRTYVRFRTHMCVSGHTYAHFKCHTCVSTHIHFRLRYVRYICLIVVYIYMCT